MIQEEKIDADTCFNAKGPTKVEQYVRLLWSYVWISLKVDFMMILKGRETKM
jgi:hypothetical protein